MFICAGFYFKGGIKHENTHLKKESCILAPPFKMSASIQNMYSQKIDPWTGLAKPW